MTYATARSKRVLAEVLVDGVPTDFLEIHTSHGADQPVGTCSLSIPCPGGVAPAHVAHETVVQVSAGLEGRGTGNPFRVIFQGVIRRVERTLGDDGFTLVCQCDGWHYVMALPQFEDVAFPGPVDAKDVIRGLYRERGFGPDDNGVSYVVQDVTDLAGADIVLGGNDDVDDGQVRIEAGESFLGYVQRIADLFRYRVFDTPVGICRVSRINGTPDPADEVADFVEGEDVFRLSVAEDANAVVTYWGVYGASGTDADGAEFAFSALPASVPSNPHVPTPPGAVYGEVSDELLVSDALCDAVRELREVDFSDLQTATSWQTWLHPTLRPGNVVGITSAGTGVSPEEHYWVVGVQHDVTNEGAFTTFQAWKGSGEALPAQDQCADESLGAGPYHVGNETFANYDVDAPEGTTKNFDFTPAADMTELSVACEAHSVNEYQLRGQTGTPSGWRLEQPVGDEVGSADLPAMHERIGAAPDWEDATVPIGGSLVSGVGARLVLVSGGPDDPPGSVDDFEVRNVALRTCADAAPDLPTEPTTPTIPPPQPQPEPSDCAFESAGGTVSPGVSVTLVPGPWVWPAGKPYLLVSGTAAGLTGDPMAAGGDPLDVPSQRVAISTHGGPYPLIVPGTQTVADPSRTGTPLVGAGAFEVWVALAPPGGPSADLVVTSAIVASAWKHPWPPASFSVADVCVRFLTTGDSP